MVSLSVLLTQETNFFRSRRAWLCPFKKWSHKQDCYDNDNIKEWWCQGQYLERQVLFTMRVGKQCDAKKWILSVTLSLNVLKQINTIRCHPGIYTRRTGNGVRPEVRAC